MAFSHSSWAPWARASFLRTTANSRRRPSAWKNCHSSKATLSRRPKPTKKPSGYSSAASVRSGKHSGQPPSLGDHATGMRSADLGTGPRPPLLVVDEDALSRSASSQPSARPLRSDERVRRRRSVRGSARTLARAKPLAYRGCGAAGRSPSRREGPQPYACLPPATRPRTLHVAARVATPLIEAGYCLLTRDKRVRAFGDLLTTCKNPSLRRRGICWTKKRFSKRRWTTLTRRCSE